MLDTESLLQLDPERNGLIAIPLIGKLKGTGKVKKHVLRSVKVPSSGISIWWWLERLRRTIRSSGRTQGPAFCNAEGYVLDSVAINEMLHESLESVYGADKMLFPFGIQYVEDIRLRYRIYRSLR